MHGRRNGWLGAGILIGSVALVASLQIWGRLQVLQLGRAVERLRVERSALQDTTARYEVEKSCLRSLSRIERIAKEEFGMRPAGEGKVFILAGMKSGNRPAPGEESSHRELARRSDIREED